MANLGSQTMPKKKPVHAGAEAQDWNTSIKVVTPSNVAARIGLEDTHEKGADHNYHGKQSPAKLKYKPVSSTPAESCCRYGTPLPEKKPATPLPDRRPKTPLLDRRPQSAGGFGTGEIKYISNSYPGRPAIQNYYSEEFSSVRESPVKKIILQSTREKFPLRMRRQQNEYNAHSQDDEDYARQQNQHLGHSQQHNQHVIDEEHDDRVLVPNASSKRDKVLLEFKKAGEDEWKQVGYHEQAPWPLNKLNPDEELTLRLRPAEEARPLTDHDFEKVQKMVDATIDSKLGEIVNDAIEKLIQPILEARLHDLEERLNSKVDGIQDRIQKRVDKEYDGKIYRSVQNAIESKLLIDLQSDKIQKAVEAAVNTRMRETLENIAKDLQHWKLKYK